MMTPERWQRIDDLYDEALRLAPELREAFLADASGDDQELRAELESLLQSDEETDQIIDRPAWEGADQLLEQAGEEHVELPPGYRLGEYEVQVRLGSGGMGEVYRALDRKLNREVAVKILPQSLARQPARASRLRREAQVLAALNHPNIAAVYDLQEQEGAWFMVMELVPGRTMAALLNDGPLPMRRALTICRDVAGALEAAHGQKVTHRDLKPANIMVTPEGRVKLLDFGIAKAAPNRRTGGMPPTVTELTQSGTVQGTLAYMSPEQARGTAVDQRSDIWSFGCVLFEALTGRRLFQGQTTSDVLAAILGDDPRLEELPAATPRGVRRLIQRCLKQHPEERLRDIGYAQMELDDMLAGEFDTSGTKALGPSAKERKPHLLAAAIAATAIATAAVAGVVAVRGRTETAPTFQRLTFRSGMVMNARFSTDGKTILYSAAWDGKPIELFEVRPESPESRRLGLPTGGLLALSKTGELAMTLGCEFNWADCSGTLAQAPMSGGAPRALAEDVYYADWSPDGKKLAVVRPVKGHFRVEYPIDTVLFETRGWITNVRVSPKGDQVAFMHHPRLGSMDGIVVVVDTQRHQKVLTGEMAGMLGLAWRPSGNEIWYTGEPSSLALHGVTLEGKDRVVWRSPGFLHVDDIAADGRVLLDTGITRRRMILYTEEAGGNREISWFHSSFAADISSDGKKVLFTEGGSDTGVPYVTYLRRTDGSDPERLGEGRAMALSPDGKKVVVLLDKPSPHLAILPTGPGQPQALAAEPGVEYFAATWFPDSRRILFVTEDKKEIRRSFVQNIDGGAANAIAIEGMAALVVSPDGKSVVAIGPDGGFYLCPVEDGLASAIRGMEPGDTPIQWGVDGRSLYVRGPGDNAVKIFRVDLESGKRRLWRSIKLPDEIGSVGLSVDENAVRITPDGKHCLYTYTNLLGELHLAEGLR